MYGRKRDHQENKKIGKLGYEKLGKKNGKERKIYHKIRKRKRKWKIEKSNIKENKNTKTGKHENREKKNWRKIQKINAGRREANDGRKNMMGK